LINLPDRRSVEDDATRQQRLRSEAQQSCQPKVTLAHAARVPAFLSVGCRYRHRKWRRRKDALHKFSRRIINRYQTIVIGDVSSLKLAKTRMAKSVLDAGWGMLKTQLQYKGQQASRCVLIVNERNTTRTCSSCGALSGPSGLDMLVVRTWMCHECGVTHDRDVNAARNILSAGRRPPSVSGNESPWSVAEPSQPYRRCEAWIPALSAAA
jgi:IS605 OrfB family transposase